MTIRDVGVPMYTPLVASVVLNVIAFAVEKSVCVVESENTP
jgi:hypothetical protein